MAPSSLALPGSSPSARPTEASASTCATSPCPERSRPAGTANPGRTRAACVVDAHRPAVRCPPHTLRKSEALFSPTTRYRDLALGPALFHWESQSTTTAASATGQRYVHHEARGSRVLLFVREQRWVHRRPGGVTEPFVCLGFATYESHEGERIWFVTEWRSACGWSGRFRRGGYW
jgi:hypothetical protein